MTKNYWTVAEDAALMESVESLEVVAQGLGRSVNAAKLRRARLRAGKVRQRPRNWMPNEDAQILAAARSRADLAAEFGATESQISSRRSWLRGARTEVKCQYFRCATMFMPTVHDQKYCSTQCAQSGHYWADPARGRALNRRMKERNPTCLRCATGTPHAFRHGENGRRYHGCDCDTCLAAARDRARKHPETRKRAKERVAARAAAVPATRRGSWSSAEDALLLRDESETAMELAFKLGRSLWSVNLRRGQLRREVSS